MWQCPLNLLKFVRVKICTLKVYNYLMLYVVVKFELCCVHCVLQSANTNCFMCTPGGLDFKSGSYQVSFLAKETTTSVFISITDDTTAELTEALSAVLTIPATATSQGITKGAADTATIDITDDDPVEVVFNPAQYNVNESDLVVTLTLNADKAASFEYTVEVVTQDGTANGN